MAIVHVQDSASTNGAGNPIAAVVNISPTAGNALVVFVTQTATASRTYSYSDDIDGTTGWASALLAADGFKTAVAYKPNVPSGVTTVTVTANTGVVAFTVVISEFSGMGTAITVDASDQLAEGADANSHTCSTSGVTSANAVIAACACELSNPSGSTECSPGSGYTETPSALAQTQILNQYQIFGAGCTNEVGAWANAGTARRGRSVIALLSGNAAAGRTTKNTRANPLGVECGMGWRMDA